MKFEDALESLIQAKAILEDNYGVVDKRTTRVKRNISLIRLKLGMIPEALQEMKEVEVSHYCLVYGSLIYCMCYNSDMFFILYRNLSKHSTVKDQSTLPKHSKSSELCT